MKLNDEFVQESIEVLEAEVAQLETGIYMSRKLRSKIEAELKTIKKLRAQYGRLGFSTKYINKAAVDLKETLDNRQAIIKNLLGYLTEKKETLKVFNVAKGA